MADEPGKFMIPLDLSGFGTILYRLYPRNRFQHHGLLQASSLPLATI
jgi:hypothetical protein